MPLLPRPPQKLGAGKYSSPEEFRADFLLVCRNAMEYNRPDTVFYQDASRMEACFLPRLDAVCKSAASNGRSSGAESRQSGSAARKRGRGPAGDGAKPAFRDSSKEPTPRTACGPTAGGSANGAGNPLQRAPFSAMAPKGGAWAVPRLNAMAPSAQAPAGTGPGVGPAYGQDDGAMGEEAPLFSPAYSKTGSGPLDAFVQRREWKVTVPRRPRAQPAWRDTRLTEFIGCGKSPRQFPALGGTGSAAAATPSASSQLGDGRSSGKSTPGSARPRSAGGKGGGKAKGKGGGGSMKQEEVVVIDDDDDEEQENVEEEVCAVCGVEESADGNEIVFCERCNVAVHQLCYGVDALPEGDWFCDYCAAHTEDGKEKGAGGAVPAPAGGSARRRRGGAVLSAAVRGPERLAGQHARGAAPQGACVLCPCAGGVLRRVEGARPGEWAHVACALWTPEVSFGDAERLDCIRGVDALDPRRRRLQCEVCGRRGGAVVQCAHGSCLAAAHIACGRRAGFDARLESKGGDGEDAVAISPVFRCGKHRRTPMPRAVAREWQRLLDRRRAAAQAARAASQGTSPAAAAATGAASAAGKQGKRRDGGGADGSGGSAKADFARKRGRASGSEAGGVGEPAPDDPLEQLRLRPDGLLPCESLWRATDLFFSPLTEEASTALSSTPAALRHAAGAEWAGSTLAPARPPPPLGTHYRVRWAREDAPLLSADAGTAAEKRAEPDFRGFHEDEFMEVREEHTPRVPAAVLSFAAAHGLLPDTTLRVARDTDVDALAALNRVNPQYSAPEHYRNALAAKNEFLLVAARPAPGAAGGAADPHRGLVPDAQGGVECLVGVCNYYLSWFLDKHSPAGRRAPKRHAVYVATLQSAQPGSHPDFAAASEHRTGAALLACALQHAKEEGVSRAYVDATEGSIAYYRHQFGFRPCARRDGFPFHPLRLDLSCFHFALPLLPWLRAAREAAIQPRHKRPASDAGDAGEGAVSTRCLSPPRASRAHAILQRAAELGTGAEGPRRQQPPSAKGKGAPETVLRVSCRLPDDASTPPRDAVKRCRFHPRPSAAPAAPSAVAATPTGGETLAVRRVRPLSTWDVHSGVVATPEARAWEDVAPGAGSQRAAPPAEGEDPISLELAAQWAKLQGVAARNEVRLGALRERVAAASPVLLTSKQEEGVLEQWRELEATEAATEAVRAREREHDLEARCHVCDRADEPTPGNLIVFCDRCNVAVHQKCYGIARIPDGEWYCDRCVAEGGASAPALARATAESGRSARSAAAGDPCVLCHGTGGAVVRARPSAVAGARGGGSQWVHVLCQALEASPAHQQADEGESCSVCRSSRGCVLRCQHPRCSTSFHATCARYAGHKVAAPECDGAEFDRRRGNTHLLRVLCAKHVKSLLRTVGKASRIPAPPPPAVLHALALVATVLPEKELLIRTIMDRAKEAELRRAAGQGAVMLSEVPDRVALGLYGSIRALAADVRRVTDVLVAIHPSTDGGSVWHEVAATVRQSFERVLRAVLVECDALPPDGRGPVGDAALEKAETSLRRRSAQAVRDVLRVTAPQVARKLDLEEYCVCRKPWDAAVPMIECSACENWYHYTCIHLAPCDTHASCLVEQQADRRHVDISGNFYCAACLDKGRGSLSIIPTEDVVGAPSPRDAQDEATPASATPAGRGAGEGGEPHPPESPAAKRQRVEGASDALEGPTHAHAPQAWAAVQGVNASLPHGASPDGAALHPGLHSGGGGALAGAGPTAAVAVGAGADTLVQQQHLKAAPAAPALATASLSRRRVIVASSDEEEDDADFVADRPKRSTAGAGAPQAGTDLPRGSPADTVAAVFTANAFTTPPRSVEPAAADDASQYPRVALARTSSTHTTTPRATVPPAEVGTPAAGAGPEGSGSGRSSAPRRASASKFLRGVRDVVSAFEGSDGEEGEEQGWAPRSGARRSRDAAFAGDSDGSDYASGEDAEDPDDHVIRHRRSWSRPKAAAKRGLAGRSL